LWAASSGERDELTGFVRQLRGEDLAAVRYVTLDYRRYERGIEMVGARTIVDPVEWAPPTFESPSGHTLDYGVELDMAGGRTWSITWLPPGMTVGLAVHGNDLLSDLDGALVAVWDVTSREPWARCVGQRIVSAEPVFEAWDAHDTWWCSRLDVLWPGVSVRLLEAEANPDGSLAPSADNIVVQWD
jgi:hypothetical protein